MAVRRVTRKMAWFFQSFYLPPQNLFVQLEHELTPKDTHTKNEIVEHNTKYKSRDHSPTQACQI